MIKFKELTKYISLLQKDQAETGFVADEKNCTKDDSVIIAEINYSETVEKFIKDLNIFIIKNKELELNKYEDILQRNGIQHNIDVIYNTDVSDKDAQCVMAMFMFVLRAERFSEGNILDFLECGSIIKWLKRLNEIDADFA